MQILRNELLPNSGPPPPLRDQNNHRPDPPPPHWALDPREVILKSQILKFWKLAKSYNVWWLTTLMIVVILFQTFFVHIWEIYYWNFERFIQNALTRSVFELEKCSFFLNGSEFRQKLIGTIIRVLVRHLRSKSGIKQWQRPLRGEVSHRSPVCTPLTAP